MELALPLEGNNLAYVLAMRPAPLHTNLKSRDVFFLLVNGGITVQVRGPLATSESSRQFLGLVRVKKYPVRIRLVSKVSPVHYVQFTSLIGAVEGGNNLHFWEELSKATLLHQRQA